MYDALNHGRIDVESLRRQLAGVGVRQPGAVLAPPDERLEFGELAAGARLPLTSFY
jgi:hypothetical protein